MSRYLNYLPLVFAVLGLFPVGTPSLQAAVDLEWQPAQQSVGIGEVVEIRLYAVSDEVSGQTVIALEVILVWDSSHLELLGQTDPCLDDPCPPNTYNWMSSSFPEQSGLNADCSPVEFCDSYTGTPFNDGNAFYAAFAQLGSDVPVAVATSEGLWVTTFLFQTLTAGVGELRFEYDLGGSARTLVVGDSGAEVTGELGPPAQVVIVECQPPTVSAIGSRYLAVTPAPDEGPVALLVTGDPGDQDVECVSLYIQADGRLDASPIFKTPAEWGTVHVGDLEIIPSTTYYVQTVCEQSHGLDLISDPVSATTWLWGDVNDDGSVDFYDITLVIDGSQGIFPGDVLLENLDLARCVPNGSIDVDDIMDVQNAVGGGTFPCWPPCAPGPDLEDFAGFASCMAGPSTVVGGDCEPFDIDVDHDVDLDDFAAFQAVFGRR
ncbi:MAG: hypothetical protein WBE26_00090 [Phycisphaerae bacterium]